MGSDLRSAGQHIASRFFVRMSVGKVRDEEVNGPAFSGVETVELYSVGTAKVKTGREEAKQMNEKTRLSIEGQNWCIKS